jgi:hypothetical protein
MVTNTPGGQPETAPALATGAEDQTEEALIAEAHAEVEAALSDIDSDDTEALYARCEQILDDIHSGRF